MKTSKTARSGFSLIELLTVIAIIAILAAILFPVFGRVREKARESTCLAQMHQLYVGMRLYREDNARYPAVLLGFAQNTVTTNTPNGGSDLGFYRPGDNITRIQNLTYKPLFNSQKYLKDKEVFACPDTKNNNPEDTNTSASANIAVTTAVYPNASPFPGQTAKYTRLVKDNCCRSVPIGEDIHYYKYDSYDISPKIDGTGKVQTDANGVIFELHYNLDWTGEAKTGPMDSQNQLKYPDAPQDSTVVTWCNNHAAYGGSDKILLLLLNGKVNPVSIRDFYNNGPLGFVK